MQILLPCKCITEGNTAHFDVYDKEGDLTLRDRSQEIFTVKGIKLTLYQAICHRHKFIYIGYLAMGKKFGYPREFFGNDYEEQPYTDEDIVNAVFE